MAPKRARTSQPVEFDRNRFVSTEAAERYTQGLIQKKIIPERGFRIEQGQFPDIDRMINLRGWGEFCKHPGPAVTSLVREFYANAYDATNGRVRVRGKEVVFDWKAINAYYSLPNIDQDEYLEYTREHVDTTEIIEYLCKPGTTWKMTRVGIHEEPSLFVARALNQRARVWLYFVSARMLPTTHVSEVTKERATLLYCLMSGRSIDVGHHLFSCIMASSRLPSARLYFPLLITGLCQSGNFLE